MRRVLSSVGARAGAALASASILVLLQATSACLEAVSDPPDFPVMCEQSGDCDQASGEHCDQGVCWGDPPEGAQFAVVLVPPEGRDDLVRTDVGQLVIAEDGSFGDVVFAPTIVVSGRVSIACDPDAEPALCDDSTSITAQIRVRRPSTIVGGPEYSRTVDALAGTYPGELAFELRLPRLATDAAPYEVSVVPQSDRTQSSGGPIDPFELAPPVRFSLDGSRDHVGVDWVLGQPEKHKIVIGRIIDAADRGIAEMQVFARGHWVEGDELARGSSVSRTDESGLFALRIPLEMLDFYELVAVPAPGMSAPTLTSKSLFIPDPDVIESPDRTVFVDDLRMPSYPAPGRFVLPVSGEDAAGMSEPVVGGDVELSTMLYDDGLVAASYTARGTTDINGEVELDLIPGGNENRLYTATVIPPPDSSHATLNRKALNVGPGNLGSRSVLSEVGLGTRTVVSGLILNADGEPVEGATVTPRASTALRFAQEKGLQTALDNLEFPSVTTDQDGAFLLWLDPALLGVTASYDVDIVPPVLSAAPRWSLADLSLGALTPGAGLTIVLPPSSFARGTVSDSSGAAVQDAELWLFQVNDDQEICQGAYLPTGATCVPPALLRGLWRSRANGAVWVVVPDIDAYQPEI